MLQTSTCDLNTEHYTDGVLHNLICLCPAKDWVADNQFCDCAPKLFYKGHLCIVNYRGNFDSLYSTKM